jgi:hypothetical protein
MSSLATTPASHPNKIQPTIPETLTPSSCGTGVPGRRGEEDSTRTVRELRCGCGRHLEGGDDAEMFGRVLDHLRGAHPTLVFGTSRLWPSWPTRLRVGARQPARGHQGAGREARHRTPLGRRTDPPEGQVPVGVRAARGRTGRRVLRAAGYVRGVVSDPQFPSASRFFGLALCNLGPRGLPFGPWRGCGTAIRKPLHFTVTTVTVVTPPYLRRFRVTINDRLHGDRHPIVTVTVTKETAWVSGSLTNVTIMTLMTVICGHVLSRGQRSSMSSKAPTG